MSVNYKFRVESFSLLNQPNDVGIQINGWLAGSTGEPVLNSAGAVDYTLAQTAKSFLPNSNYQGFLEGVIASALATKYDTTFSAVASNSSSLLTGISTTVNALPGMNVTGVGIIDATTVLSAPSSSSILLSLEPNLTFSGFFTGPSITITGSITTGSFVVSGISSTSGVISGMTVTAAGLPQGTTVLTVLSSTEIQVTVAATATGSTTLTLATNPQAATVTEITPAVLTTAYQNLSVTGTNLDPSSLAKYVTSSSSMTLSTNALSSGTASFTFSGQASYKIDTSTWVIDYSEIAQIVAECNFGSL